MDYFQIELDNTSKDKNYWIEQIYLDALMLLRFSKQLPEAERKSLESGVNNKLMSIIEKHNGTCNTNRLKHILDDKGKEIRKLYKIIRFKSIFSFLYRTIFY